MLNIYTDREDFDLGIEDFGLLDGKDINVYDEEKVKELEKQIQEVEQKIEKLKQKEGQEEAKKAKEASRALFQGQGSLENMPTHQLNQEDFNEEGVI